MSRDAATHRIVCADHIREARSFDAARRYRIEIETAGNCQNVHTIEVRTAEGWAPLHLVRAQQILTADVGALIETLDGPMIKNTGGWSKQTSARGDAVADPAVDLVTWRTAAGPQEYAILTADGRGAHLDSWCSCSSRATDWIRYERWTVQGRAGHGYLCPTCRHLKQTG